MWRLMRLLKSRQHEHGFARTEFEPMKNETDDQRIGRQAMQLMETVRRIGDPEVLKVVIITAYLSKYYPRLSTLSGDAIDRDKTNSTLGTVNSIIANCKQKGFVVITDNDHGVPAYIQITLPGKKFATVEGLLKEWISDDLGILFSLIVTAGVSIFGTINFPELVTLTSPISPWW